MSERELKDRHSERGRAPKPRGFHRGPLWAGCDGRWIGFFRIFGYGLHWKDSRRHRLLWSERQGVYVHWHFGPWVITPLKRGARGFRRSRFHLRPLRAHELALVLAAGVVVLMFSAYWWAALTVVALGTLISAVVK